jgi:hypothetical protein
MFFSVQDNDWLTLMATGRNSLTREQAIQDIFELVQNDMDEADRKSSDLWPIDEKEEYVTCLCNFEIIEHEVAFPEGLNA